MAMRVSEGMRGTGRSRHVDAIVEASVFRRKTIPLAVAALLAGAHAASAGQPGQILPAGTIPELRGVVFGNATVNAPVAITGGNRLTIDQTSQKAIIDWNKFDIARGSEVRFNQPGASASALNRIWDADPSIIQGRLTANGQIYLINQNGILFDRGSQVNVSSLVASTLNTTDSLFLAGLSSYQGREPNFQGTTGYSRIEIGSYGPAGETATITAQPGGSIYVLAPQIVNGGVLNAPDGQVILAAGQKVRLFQDPGADFTMRGMFVEVQADKVPLNLSSLVTNAGHISADRGNVTLAALAVNQMNSVTARTAVNLNGSVWLLAQDRLTLGSGSVTQTPIISDNTTTLADDQDFQTYRPVVRMVGNVVDIEGSVTSPYGLISIQANQRAYVGSGARISAAGSWADIPLEKNLLTIKLTTNDLKDDPVQKGGFLLGQTVAVDVRNGNPQLFDLSTYAGSIQRTVAEKTALGGDITFNSGSGSTPGDIIIRNGAVLDVSGGGYRYSGGRLNTTKLISGGKIYDISAASPELRYDAVAGGTYQVKHAKWGVTETFAGIPIALAPYEPGYVEGKPAGTIQLTSSDLVIDGTLRGGATIGRLQTTPDKAPSGGQVIIGDPAAETSGSFNFRLGNVVFAKAPAVLLETLGVDDALPPDRVGAVYVDPGAFGKSSDPASSEQFRQGFGRVAVYANGRIDVPAEATIATAPGGSVKLEAHEINIAGDILSSGGRLEIKSVASAGSTGTSSFYLSGSATLSTAGVWINDALGFASAAKTAPLVPAFLDAGSVSISAVDARFAAETMIDVSGGARYATKGKVSWGKAGSISISAGADIGVLGTLDLSGNLYGYSGAGGGSLNLAAHSAQLGGVSQDPATLVLDPRFFTLGGFSSYGVNGIFGLTIAPGTRIHPVSVSPVLDSSLASTAPSGGGVRSVSNFVLQPVDQRQPASLTVSASDSGIGFLDMQSNTQLTVDPGTSIGLSAGAAMKIAGTIEAPAGAITLTVKRSQYADVGTSALELLPGAALLSRGYVQLQPNSQALLLGQVLRGGQVTITTSKGSLLVDEGSLVDVSGTVGRLDIPDSSTGRTAYSRRQIAGEAGTIVIKATEPSRLDGRFLGNASQATAGGSFALEFARHGDETLADVDHRLIVSQNPIQAVPQSTPLKEAFFSLASIKDGGFGNIRLLSSEELQFQGDVNLDATRAVRIDSPLISVKDAALVSISAPRVTVASSGDQLRTTAAPRSFATSPGTGTLAVASSLVDFYGSVTVNGVAAIDIRSSGDIRGTGKPVATLQADGSAAIDRLTGALISEGDISLAGSQVYPTSSSTFTFAVNRVDSAGARSQVSGGTITVSPVTSSAGPVYSAGGSITFDADNVVQNGTVKAPLGNIAFDAGNRLILGPGSRTSVSTDGLVIPFGTTVNGLSWVYDNMVALTTPPDKRIALNGRDISIAHGALLDVSGGGDLEAVEWVPGIGGSADTLLQSGVYAIVPAASLAFAPYDSHLLSLKDIGLGKDGSIYDSVYLSAGAGVPAGQYVLLPGYYALLPGAYIVQKQTGAGYRDVQPGSISLLADGTSVVAGKLATAGTGLTEARWSGFAVRPGSEALRQSEYRVSGAAFFGSLAASNDKSVTPLPRDAGRLAIAALNNLDFDGVLRAEPAAGGQGAQVDITAAQLAVVAHKGQGEAPAGYVELEAETLSAFNGSLLLGGTRSDGEAGTLLAVGASAVTIAPGADLRGPEIILAATGSVEVQSGASVRGEGAFAGSARDLRITGADGNGALLRVSSGNQVNVTRTGAVDRSHGTLTIESGAQVSAARSLILDSTLSTQSSGSLAVADGGFISLGAGSIRMGNAPVSADSLLIGSAELAAFTHLDTVALRSYTGIDFYGDVAIGSEAFNRITLDAAAINGFGGGRVSVRARSVSLQNTSSGVTQSTAGTGTLDIFGDQISIGAGSKAVSGFEAVTIGARGDITGSGTGELRVAGELTLESVRVTGAQKSDQTIIAVDDSQSVRSYYKVTTRQPVAPLSGSGTTALGAKLAITGSSVDHSGDIELPAGSATLTATGAGGITLQDGSRVFTGGAAKTFGPAAAFAPAGGVSLVALRGDVVSTAASTLDVSGAASGGDAGTFSLTMGGTGAAVRLDGILKGSAASGYRQGSAVLDLSSAGNFSALNAKLNQGGFGESRDIRVRSGDVTIAGRNPFTQRPGDVVIAQHFKLAVDQGSITVGGMIDASASSGGGSIELDAMNDVNLAGGSFLLALGTSAAAGTADAYSHGGRVEVSSRTGTLNMAAGAVVDVSANAAGKSDGGRVTFSARRTVDATGADADVAVTLAGVVDIHGGTAGGKTGSVKVEGVHAYDIAVNAQGVADTVSASVPGSVAMRDYQSFAGNSTGIAARLFGQGLQVIGGSVTDLHIAGGIELHSSGDLVVSSPWDLTSAEWMQGGEPGRLTLRAVGNLTIKNNLGLPSDLLPAGRTWDISLVGGADLTAANPMAVLPKSVLGASGDVVLARLSGTVNTTGGVVGRVRTGTGSIGIAAGRDFAIRDAGAVVYTAGEPGVDGTVVPGQAGSFPVHGGSISISAQGDAVGPGPQAWINNWLRRTVGITDGQPAAWWVNRSTFQDNIGAFGGGRIEIAADRDISQLSAVSATSGRVSLDSSGVANLDVQGGGEMILAAGRDVIGGEYLLSRGTASLAAGGTVGASSRTALFLMGESNDTALKGANFRVSALGDINLQNISNPTMMTLSTISGTSNSGRSYFFTYADDARVGLESIAGNVFLGNLATSKSGLSTAWSDIYPPQVEAIAFQGDILGGRRSGTDGAVRMFPSTTGSLRLLAGGNVGSVGMEVIDAAASVLPLWSSASQNFGQSPLPTTKVNLGTKASGLLPSGAGEYDYVVGALTGSVYDSRFLVPKQAIVEAAVDVENVDLALQNLRSDDLSIVRAGRDIRYLPQYRSGTPVVSGGGSVQISGPGRLLLQAGRNISFGLSSGIQAVGDTFNQSMRSSDSAALTLIAGVSGDVFGAIDPLFTELKAAGIVQDGKRGQRAIQAVFNEQNTASGDITMFFSTIKTLGGSGIDLLAPGGNINVGLPTPQQGDIGIVTTFGGGIRSYLKGDFNVNLSKVVSLQGGDILIYTEQGNIDAGRGARSSRTTQPPRRVIKPDGTIVFIPPREASGSGIRSLTSDPDGPGPLVAPKPGDVFLFAPSGFVDAGEAGVSSAGNIFVAALQVLNASNFSASGTAAGVPVAVNTGVSAAVAGAGNVGASAAKSADEVTKSLAASSTAAVPKETYRPSFITVELLGIGDENSAEDSKSKK